MSDVAIIGGGISGLASAWFLKQRGLSVRVFEAGSEPGGTLKSVATDGFLVEGGPNSTLENTDALGELVRGVGLADQVQEANPLAKRRYILKHGKLIPLPLGPGAFIRTPLFSPRGKLRLFAEPIFRRAPVEESIASFVRRRLGREFLDWAIDPFISGVYAGDPEHLSVRAATRKIYALEAQYGSLFVGALARILRGQRSGPAPSGRLIAFAGGMQTLPRAVAGALGEGAVLLGASVAALERDPQFGWRIRVAQSDEVFVARHVVLCVPAYAAGVLLQPLAPLAARELGAIEYPPVASVALGFDRDQVGHPLDGFGFLIPRAERLETLGSLFSSTLFPGRAGDGRVLLTSFIGGARNPAVAGRDAAELVARVLRDIRPILGIQGEPTFRRVTAWRHAIPQYQLGHLERLERIDAALTDLDGLHARANWRDGISVADCVRNARDLARHFAAAAG